ncbi:hypothetical protein [Methylobacterium sp. D54C]
MLDMLSILKICSGIVTGILGIVGILGDFKDKDTKAITKWGYFSLAGIISSMIVGAIIQLLEQNGNAADKARSTEVSQSILSNSQKSVNNLDRMLFKIGKPNLYIELTNTCSEDTKRFCKAYASAVARNQYVDPKAIKTDDSPFKDFAVWLSFYKSKNDYLDTLASTSYKPDLRYLVEANSSYASHSRESV